MIHAHVDQVRNLKVVTVRWSNHQIVLLQVKKEMFVISFLLAWKFPFIYLICEVMMNQEQVKISLSRICAKMLLQFDKAMLIYGKQGNRHAWPYRL